MVDDKFNYASTSEEFSVEAENLKGESVREVAEAQEAQEEREAQQENEPKTPDTSDRPHSSGKAERERK
jgi:hypothetical protein